MLSHKGTVVLKTERLTLRPFRLTDAEDMYNNWGSDPEVPKYVSWDVHESADFTRELLGSWIENYEKPDYYNWTLEFEGQAIGNVAVVSFSRWDGAEIGYCMSRRFWNLGIMTEAVSAVTDFLFAEVGCKRIRIRNMRGNPASGRVAEKCGYSFEGIEREAARAKDGSVQDIESRSLLRDEWERLKAGPNTVLETERLILRAPGPGDFEGAHAYSSDPENAKYIFWGPNTPADTRRFLRRAQTEWAKRIPRQYDFVLVRKEDSQLIGGCGLSVSGSLGEIGWILGRSFQHKGYATEAARAVLGFGFQRLGLRRIRARCDARNEPSFHVMERLGMRREAAFRSARPARGEWSDEYEYAILGEEWEG